MPDGAAAAAGLLAEDKIMSLAGREVINAHQWVQQIRDNPELPVQVISHVNPSSNTDYDWEVSIDRALTVARDLATFGVDGGRLLPAGQGSNQPIVPATNARAQMVNGRTVIAIPLPYLQLLNGMGGN